MIKENYTVPVDGRVGSENEKRIRDISDLVRKL
jgi:hypothetical protein